MIRRPATIVVLLTGLNLLNFLDRWVISAVSPSMKKELGLSDWQTGIVLNAFLVGFLLTSPIFGRLGDLVARKWLIAGGVSVWCLATAASGLFSAFAPLVAVRALVGIGEASYSSLAPTMLDDVAPAPAKGRVLAVFFAAIPIGSALGFILGGQLDAHYGWRNAFFVAGGPGLVLAIACLFMVEPRHAHAKVAPPPLGASLRRILSSRRYLWAVLGAIPQSAVLGCFASWAPHFLERKLGMATADADARLGLTVVVTGFVGAFIGGFLADAVKGEDRLRAAMKVCAISALVSVPFSFGTIAATTTTSFFVWISLAQVAIWASFSPYNAVVLGAVPPEARATAMALNIFAMHAFGDLPAVPLVGLLSDRLHSLPDAMKVLPPMALVGALAWVVAWRTRDREGEIHRR